MGKTTVQVLLDNYNEYVLFAFFYGMDLARCIPILVYMIIYFHTKV